jgi:hypothetical protein
MRQTPFILFILGCPSTPFVLSLSKDEHRSGQALWFDKLTTFGKNRSP